MSSALANQMSALSALKILNAVDCANTAAATSGWIDLSGYEGQVAVVISTGILDAGSIDYTFQDATSGAGAGAASTTPIGGAIAQITTANDDDDPVIALFDVSKLRGFLQVIGTIVTGGALVSYTLIGRKKTV